MDNLLNIIEKISDSSKLLLVNSNEVDILDKFSYIIKKKNLLITLLIDDKLIFNQTKESIIGEECENNIILIKEINLKENYDLIYVCRLTSLNNLENILIMIPLILNDKTLIYMYNSISNESSKKIHNKNYIRSMINLGYILSLTDVLNIINKNNNFNIKSMSIYKENNYIIYGNNTVYEFILEKKNII